MRALRVIHGYNNGDIKWCVVCVDHGLRDAPVVSRAYDSAEEAERELTKLAGPPTGRVLQLPEMANDKEAGRRHG